MVPAEPPKGGNGGGSGPHLQEKKKRKREEKAARGEPSRAEEGERSRKFLKVPQKRKKNADQWRAELGNWRDTLMTRQTRECKSATFLAPEKKTEKVREGIRDNNHGGTRGTKKNTAANKNKG